MANSQKQLIINHCSLRPPKSSIQPKLSTILDLFMQNKANFKKVKFYITKYMTKDYENGTLGVLRKTKPNKANSKPIKANLKNAKNERKPSINKEIRKMLNWAIYENKANSNPKQTQFLINELRTMNNQIIKNKPKLSCVASGQARTNPTSKPKYAAPRITCKNRRNRGMGKTPREKVMNYSTMIFFLSTFAGSDAAYYMVGNRDLCNVKWGACCLRKKSKETRKQDAFA
jgi:hypothetical protein